MRSFKIFFFLVTILFGAPALAQVNTETVVASDGQEYGLVQLDENVIWLTPGQTKKIDRTCTRENINFWSWQTTCTWQSEVNSEGGKLSIEPAGQTAHVTWRGDKLTALVGIGFMSMALLVTWGLNSPLSIPLCLLAALVSSAMTLAPGVLTLATALAGVTWLFAMSALCFSVFYKRKKALFTESSYLAVMMGLFFFT